MRGPVGALILVVVLAAGIAAAIMLASGDPPSPSASAVPALPPGARPGIDGIAAVPATNVPTGAPGDRAHADAAATTATPGAGAVLVVVRDPGGDGFETMSVSVQPSPVRSGGLRINQEIAADGSARIEPLAAGSYQLVLARSNRSSNGPPLPGGGPDPLTVRKFEVRTGETTTVEVEAMPLGRIVGHVRLRGAAAEGVFVFAVTLQAGEEAERHDDENAPRFHPCVTTASDGAFRFDYQRPGRWHVHVRHPRAALTSAAAVITADRPGQVIEHDFSLGGATIRGMAAGSGAQRVSLFRASEAAADPWSSETPFGSHLFVRERKSVSPTSGDAFAFEFLAAGSWVVRVVDPRQLEQRIVAQRFVRTLPDETVDLGRLLWTDGVDVRVRTVHGPDARPWSGFVFVRQKFAGLTTPVFLRRAMIRGGSLELPRIAPGDYEIAPVRPNEASSATLRILGDGSTDPTVLRF